MGKTDKKSENEPVPRTHRSQMDLAIDKVNKAFTNIEKQIANLIKAKRNILLSGDRDLGAKFNIALNKFGETFTELVIVDSDFDVTKPIKETKDSFSIMEMDEPEPETE